MQCTSRNMLVSDGNKIHIYRLLPVYPGAPINHVGHTDLALKNVRIVYRIEILKGLLVMSPLLYLTQVTEILISPVVISDRCVPVIHEPLSLTRDFFLGSHKSKSFLTN